MSTPSTATTTIPAHHSQYGYAQHNPCSANSSSYPANNSVPTPRLTASYHTFPATNSNSSYTRNQRSPQSSKQPSHAASMATSQSASARPRNQKKPDWEEFYKNGIPKEIIVIDDDSPPPKPPPRTASRRGGKAAAAGSTQSMAGRKRKVDQGYDTGYHDSPAFSTHPARFGENSSDLSISTDRTTSLQAAPASPAITRSGAPAKARTGGRPTGGSLGLSGLAPSAAAASGSSAVAACCCCRCRLRGQPEVADGEEQDERDHVVRVGAETAEEAEILHQHPVG